MYNGCYLSSTNVKYSHESNIEYIEHTYPPRLSNSNFLLFYFINPLGFHNVKEFFKRNSCIQNPILFDPSYPNKQAKGGKNITFLSEVIMVQKVMYAEVLFWWDSYTVDSAFLAFFQHFFLFIPRRLGS